MSDKPTPPPLLSRRRLLGGFTMSLFASAFPAGLLAKDARGSHSGETKKTKTKGQKKRPPRSSTKKKKHGTKPKRPQAEAPRGSH